MPAWPTTNVKESAQTSLSDIRASVRIVLAGEAAELVDVVLEEKRVEGK